MMHQLLNASSELLSKVKRRMTHEYTKNCESRAGKRGFTLLLAAIVSSVVLALGASIYSLAIKEVTLSSLGRDSQTAFYTADQAAECALYWDIRWGYFGTTTPPEFLPPNDPLCDGQHWTPVGGEGRPTAPPYYPYTITFQYSPRSGSASYCANVSILKCDGEISAGGVCTSEGSEIIHTRIHADGYSTTCASQSTSPRALQRSVELHY